MFAPNRRQERRPEILQKLCDDGFYIHDIVDYTISENEGIFLEGTGSMVLDRQNRVAYAALSPRTCESLFRRFCEDFDYHPIIFTAFQTVQGKRAPVYHTNVMMSVADRYAILCAQSIDSPAERKMVEQSLQTAGKEIIEISEQQMQSFAGNMLQVANRAGDKFMIMSKQAYYSLYSVQIAAIESYSGIITAAVPTIEQQGGGSVRCMLAEIFLPRRY
jgi:hypothetical protein